MADHVPPSQPLPSPPEDPGAPRPEHLWAGDWEAWSEEAVALRRRQRHQAAPRPQGPLHQSAADPAEPPAPPRRPLRLVMAGVIAALLAAVAVVVGISALGDDEPKPVSALPAISKSFVKPKPGQTRAGAVYDAASPAVASVRAGRASGTAFLIDSKGTLVTNAHVVGTSNSVTVRFGPDDDPVDADVLGRDASTDLAVLSIEPSHIPKGVRPLQLADSRTVQVGDLAIAIGSPFGLERTATEGIVSALGRAIEAPNGFSIDEVIQTDAPINPGNSGGPLLDAEGRVIGVTSQIATAGTEGNIGIGFAVPSNTVRQVVPVLARGETVERGYLGVESGETPAGVEVGNVVPGGPADDGGLQAGDLILRFDGKGVGAPSELSALVAAKRPGDTAKIDIERDGSKQTLTVTLGTRPDRTP